MKRNLKQRIISQPKIKSVIVIYFWLSFWGLKWLEPYHQIEYHKKWWILYKVRGGNLNHAVGCSTSCTLLHTSRWMQAKHTQERVILIEWVSDCWYVLGCCWCHLAEFLQHERLPERGCYFDVAAKPKGPEFRVCTTIQSGFRVCSRATLAGYMYWGSSIII